MFRFISCLLIVLVFFMFSMGTYNQAYALDKEIKEEVIKTAKIAAILFLISKASDLFSDSADDKINEGVLLEDNQVVTSSNMTLDDKVIVIDPGHGGSDPGAIGVHGLKEKDINLDIALKLYELLSNKTKAEIYLTRDSDSFVSLNERSSFARSINADIYLSIHNNADENGQQHGTETYAYYTTAKETWALAWYIHKNIVDRLGFLDRGLKADNFHVIRETPGINSILLEIGFLSNEEEEAILMKDITREQAAVAIYEGIVEYFAN